MSLLISYYCFCTLLGRLSLAPSLCDLSPFLLSYVAVSRPCCFMLEVYPNFVNMDIKGATENVRINRVFVLSIGHNVRAFFPQG